MFGNKLEAKLVISADDKTGKAFDAIERRVKRLNQSMGGVGQSSGLVSRMSRYLFGGGDAAGAASERLAVRSAERARARQMKEIAEAKAYRREMLATGLHPTLGLGAGLAAGLAVHEAVKVSADRVHEQVRMQVAGMSAKEIRLAENESAKIAADFPAIGQTEIMHMMRNARSIVGSYTEAAEIMEPLTKLRIIAQGARPGQDVSEDFDQLVKGLEIKGVTQDPKKFHSYMEGIAKGLNVFGDTLKPYQYYEMFKYGRQATPMLSERFMLGTAPTLAQELGGSSYGNAVSGFNRSIVAGRMEHSAMKEMVKIGLLKKSDVDLLKTGEVKGIKPGHAVAGWQLAQSDPNQWVRQYLLPALAEKGITDPAAIMKEIGTLFSNRMSAQLVSLLATQQSRIDKDMALLDHAKGLSAADEYMSKDPKVAYQGLKGALEGMVGTLGEHMASALTPTMNDLSKAIAGYTARITQAHLDRDDGKVPDGQKTLNRLINSAVYGVDSDKAPYAVTPFEKTDADYERTRARLVKRLDEPGDTPNPDWDVIQWGLKHPNEPYPDDQLGRDSHIDPRRDAIMNRLDALDDAHDARVAAQRDLDDHAANLKRAMRFAGPMRADAPYEPTIGPASPDAPLGTSGYFPTSRRMSYGEIDKRSGAPSIYGPVAPEGAFAAKPAAMPDLSSLLSGKVEASVQGQATVDVKVTVVPGSELVSATAAAKAATMQLRSAGGAAGSKAATGTSMNEAAPGGRGGTGKQ